MEKGSIILIGAATENLSFEINSALLSRCRVFVLRALETDEIVQLIRRALHNAPMKLMKDLAYGEGYRYAHDYEDNLTDMQCLPDSLIDRRYCYPTDQGDEKRLRERFGKIRE